MKCIISLLVFFATSSVFAASLNLRIEYFLYLNSLSYDFPTRVSTDYSETEGHYISLWRYDIPTPLEVDLPSVEDTLAWDAARGQARELARQAAKPAERKAYENAFFSLTEELLALTEDERAGQDPPTKLGFPDIQTLIETIQATDPMAAVNFSLKLLTIDAALKRYDILWWDDAFKHDME